MPEIKAPALKSEIGSTGTMVVGGYLTDQDYNKDLIGEQGLRIYDQMRKGDGTVRAALMAIKLPILRAHWYVKPATDDERDVQIAEQIEQNLFDGLTHSFHSFLRKSLLMLDYGRMLFEIVYELKPDGTLGWKKFAERLPHTIEKWETDSGNPGVVQRDVNGGGTVDIPIEKMVVFVNEMEGENWEGISVLRSAYRHWKIKDALYKFDAIAHERYGVGVPIAKLPSNVTPQDEADVVGFLKNWRVNEEAFFKLKGAEWDLKLLEGGGGSRDPHKSIAHHNRQILLSILAQFLDLGSGATGSYALNRVQQDLFLLSLNAICEEVAETFNKYAVERWMAINYPGVTEMPKLEYAKIGGTDVNQLTTALQRLAQAGLLTIDENLEDYVRDQMDLPPVEEGLREERDLLAMVAEVEAGANAPVTEGGEEETEEDDFAEEEPEEDLEADETSWTEAVVNTVRGALGQPLSDEHKQKISEKLKEYWATRRKSGGGGSGDGKKKGGKKGSAKKSKKQTEAEKAAKEKERARKKELRAQIKGVRMEMRDAAAAVKLQLLKARASGKKIEPQEMAKIQLRLETKRQALQRKIDSIDMQFAEGELEGVLAMKERFDALIDAVEKQAAGA